MAMMTSHVLTGKIPKKKKKTNQRSNLEVW